MANSAPSESRVAPLAGWEGQFAQASEPGVVELDERPFLAHVNLRLDPSDLSARARVLGTLGVELPVSPNTVSDGAGHAALWLAPDEWLFVGPTGSEGEIVASLQGALAPYHHSVLDITANRTTLELAGSRAREVLATGCALDLHPRVFGPGRCAQTLYAKTQVVVWQVDHVPTFRLLVRPSFARYLAEFLCDAMLEWRGSSS